MDSESKHRFPLSLTILPTYRCSAACQDCCFASDPFVKGEIPLENILNYIDQAARIETMRLIVFSGGEAFLLGKKLDIAVARASQHRLLTRIVTNAYWATSEESALKRLTELKNAGLTELNASTGDYHQLYVPIKNVVNATLAALSIGMPMCIVVESRLERKFTQKNLHADERLTKALEDPKKKKIFKLIESPWMPNFHSAEIGQDKGRLLNRTTLHSRRGCRSVLSNMVVTPYERLGACCGLTREQIQELDLGNLKENSMEELYKEAIEDFMKIWMLVEGPEHILAWAADKDSSIEWENKYAHQCDACRAVYHDPKVRQVIREHYQEKEADVLFRFSLIDKAKLEDAGANSY
jgi:pyruvate-formate lyase-activating enzyme